MSFILSTFRSFYFDTINSLDYNDYINRKFSFPPSLLTKFKLPQNSPMIYKETPWEFIEKYYTDDLSERNTPESQWSLAWLKYVKGKKILSVGCGPNYYDDVQFFGNIPQEFVGIDINRNNISFLEESSHPEVLKWKKYLNDNQVKVRLLNNNIEIEQSNFRNKFDSIYSIGVLGMFDAEKTKKIFSLLYGYLKPNGTLIDVDWTECKLSAQKMKEREDYRWYSPYGPSIKEIGKILKDSGFKISRHNIFNVANPKIYGWGKIYGFIVKKIVS